jgi:hypothetical protein
MPSRRLSLYEVLAESPAMYVLVGETVTTRQKETLDNDAETAEFDPASDALSPGSHFVSFGRGRSDDECAVVESAGRAREPLLHGAVVSLHDSLSTSVSWSRTVGETALTASKETVDADAESVADDGAFRF